MLKKFNIEINSKNIIKLLVVISLIKIIWSFVSIVILHRIEDYLSFSYHSYFFFFLYSIRYILILWILLIAFLLFKKIKSMVKLEKVYLKSSSGLLKECKIGFSWVVFLFAGFVALFRGDLKWFIIFVICFCSVIGLVLFFYFSIKYNTIYVRELMEKGYKPYKIEDKKILERHGIVFAK